MRQNVNMKLSNEAIMEFIEIYFQKKGIRLSYKHGAKMASDWMAFYRIVKQKPYMNKNEYDNNNRISKK